MKLPVFKNKSSIADPVILQWKGLNQNALISDDQLSATSNASTKNYPILSPRPSREAVYTLSGTGYALSHSSTYLAWVDGTNFKYNNTTEGAVTASAKSIVDFNGKLYIFPDKKTYDYTTDTFAAMQGYIDMQMYGFDTNGDIDYSRTDLIRNKNIISITPSTNYQLTNDKGYTDTKIFYYDINKTLIAYSELIGFDPFTSIAAAYYMNFDITGTDLTVKVTLTNAVYPTESAIPTISYATVLDNRIWAVHNDDIYACSLGDGNNWTTFNAPAVSTDAWQVDTGTGGNFTGAVTYADSVFLFKKDKMWQLFGTDATNFQYQEISELGCIDGKTALEVNNMLFYLGRKGVYRFTGGLPELVSMELNETYSSGVAGTDDRRYYLSLYNGTSYKLYVFDTYYNVWFMEDTLQVKDFGYLDGYLYALANDNKIYKFNSGSETVTMEVTTKEFTENAFQRKGTIEVNVLADLESGSTLTVYSRVNNGSFTAIKTAYATTDLNSLRIPVSVNRANHYQLKLSLVGEGKIYGIERKMYIGGKI